MPKVSPEHMQARRDQIARAAVEQFSLRGIHSTSMANIIEASGLSAGAIYRHFAGKDEIIAYVARATINGVFDGVRGLLDAEPLPSPAEVMILIAHRLDQTDVSFGNIVQVWGEAAANPTVHAIANEVYASAFDFLREYLAIWLTANQGLDLASVRDQAPAQARLMVSLVYAYILQRALIDGHDHGRLADSLATLLPGPPAG
ncbi:MAG: TetR/AcrR family transcriptional regulator [Propionibacteriaceae bacterium]|jgi:AcrR family transcriptional regulator|nr:TetR/AcrR family transcriptional regulator [Propionibacteriaceae bacterium]